MISGEQRSELPKRKLPPFLKWAGGKRWLVSAGIPAPTNFERLVEPFLGSAAVFFAMTPESALLTDLNHDLINLFQVVQEHPLALQLELEGHHRAHSKAYYYMMRAKEEEDTIRRAARMLYLNRTCWNGLYRVNKKGEFNVPIGTKSTVVMQGEIFSEYAKVLRSASFMCQDFEVTIDSCGDGDFLFVDPPYTVKHNMNGFVKYNEQIFNWDDQIRLVAALRRAGKRGASILVTNADHESVLDLYRGDFEYRSVARNSVLAGSASHRGRTTEALFGFNIPQF